MTFREKLSSWLKTFRWASWLGWQIESNWASPFLFFTYSVIKPIAGCLILVFMYLVVTRGKTQTDLFYFMYIGNAFFMFILGSIFGMSLLIHVEREHYQTIKYVYVSPANIFLYLTGRGMARIFITSLAVIITLLFGILVFHIPITPATINLPLLLIALFLGFLCVIAIGITLVSISMVTAMHGFNISEAVGSIFFFMSGVLFPVSSLPSPLKDFSMLIPFTYWTELIRRSILPGLKVNDPLMQSMTTGRLLSMMTVFTFILIALSFGVFKYFDYRTREEGSIDRKTAY